MNILFDTLIPRNLKGLLLRLLFFMMPLVVLIAVIEYRLAKIPNTYKIKDEGAKAATNTEVLILGSSHTLKGINPAGLSRPAFNLANVSQTLPFDLAMLTRYAPNMPKLRWVIVPISYTSMFESLEATEPFRTYFYARFNGYAAPNVDQLSFPMVSYTALYGPRVSLRMALDPSMTEAKGLMLNGFQSTASAEDLYPATAALRMAEHHHGMSISNWPANQKALYQIINYCNAHRLRLLLITLPVHPDYRALQQPNYIHETDSLVRTINNSAKVPYLNLDGDPIVTDNMFSDPDHLSLTGATFATKTINEVLHRLDNQDEKK